MDNDNNKNLTETTTDNNSSNVTNLDSNKIIRNNSNEKENKSSNKSTSQPVSHLSRKNSQLDNFKKSSKPPNLFNSFEDDE